MYDNGATQYINARISSYMIVSVDIDSNVEFASESI